MKYIIFSFLLSCLYSIAIQAQNNTIIAPVQNSVTTVIPLEATTTESSLNGTNSLKIIQYSDGLGHPNIKIAKGIISSGKDLISMTGYDAMTQSHLKFLPFPVLSNDDTPNPTTMVQTARTFHADNSPYLSVKKNNSPMAPLTQITRPGQIYRTNNKKQTIQIWRNFAANVDYGDGYPLDRAKHYIVVNNGVQYVGEYGNNQLKYVYLEDEDGKIQCRYYDLSGKLILDRALRSYQKDNSGDFSSIVGCDTYYVYDDMDHLCFVLSPEASDRMSNPNVSYTSAGANTANNPIDQYAYLYRYDAKDRCIAQKLPGADWIYYVYDKAGRLIMEQTGNQRLSNQWSFNKYDRFGRVIQTGTVTTGTSHSNLQTNYNNITVVESWQSGTGYTNSYNLGSTMTLLAQYYYDSYDFLNRTAYASIKNELTYSLVSGYDAKCSRIVESNDISLRGVLTGTATALLGQSGELVTALYYDDRGQIVQSLSTNHLNGYDKHYFSRNFSGLPTKYRHVHKAYSNHPITENYTYNYNKAGQITNLYHAINNLPNTLLLTNSYNDLGQLTATNMHRGMNTVQYGYNLQGQIKSIQSPQFSQQLTYQGFYNGNIKKKDETMNGITNTSIYSYDNLNRINASYSTNPNHSVEYYDTFYSYDKNGNITSLERFGQGTDFEDLDANGTPKEKWDFLDNLALTYKGNQLTSVSEWESGLYFSNMPQYGSESSSNNYLYDANGNMSGNSNKNMSWIQYNLLNLPSKIQYSNGKKTEYIYDATGQKRKVIYSTSQTRMQIPLGSTSQTGLLPLGSTPQASLLPLGSTSQASLLPLGSTSQTGLLPLGSTSQTGLLPLGSTSQASIITVNINKTFTADYCGNFYYYNGKLQSVFTPVGYINATNADSTQWQHVYFMKDYQGNVRSELISSPLKHPTSATCSAQSRKSYYPFGLIKDIFGTGASGKFQFSGNEHESMNGLNMHDFHFRWYDQELGRFTTMDPLAENHYNTSPYAYCGNNPINRIDPRGLDWYWNNGNIDDITWFEGDEDREGFDYHSPTATGMDEDYYYYYQADGSIKKERRKEAEITGYGNSWGGFGLWPENNYSNGDDDGGTGSSSGTTGSSGGIDAMDIANYVVSNTGTVVGGAQFALHSMKNDQQWKYAYKAHKVLKKHGIKVQTRVIKHGADGVLKNASRNITYAGIFLTGIDIAIDGEIRASHLLNLGMIGVSAIPGVGWIIGGGYFAADMITLGVSGRSIGQHLDNAAGEPLWDIPWW